MENMVEESKAKSLKGYKFKVWLKRNKKDLKFLVSTITGLSIALTINVKPLWAGFLGIVIGIISRMMLDGIDFWLSDVEIELISI